MEKIKEIFEKNIERSIQGVIKVDDESFISQELEEYIVTEELLKYFNTFISAYNKGLYERTDKMGVWISGFFGSGKSHFLKIISYLLENKVVDGKKSVDYFDSKIKDPHLLAEIKRAGSVPTDVILFNIDSKTGNTQGQKDKILDVFEKVFNEKLGLSITPFVAEIERFIIKQGKYEEFKKEFLNIKGTTWEEERDAIQFVEDEFAKAYSKVLEKTIEEAREIVSKTENNYSISIENFAVRVREYIEIKGDNHHVVFLVDEIGQYIGDDKQLMLNLQTITENLGTECGGKAWLFVTSQEAIDEVIKVHGDDFSKIQGRFDTKLSLSSTDIDEVIKKRLLTKTDAAKESLKIMYEQDESIINNLLFFKDAAYQETYTDADNFADIYPFIPYQFKLLQNVFNDIRKHGYAGKHLSSGERSLLGAFQETAINYKDYEKGHLMPFYTFYDTIEQFLESHVKTVIKTAEDTVKSGKLEKIDISVLKMLFMLKNIKEIPANIDNLATLYVSHIKDDKIKIKNQITDSLKRLEKQTLIQRNNEIYKFLTDDEQEINREIKNIPIEEKKITDYINSIVFESIYRDTRINYKNKNFPLTKIVDNAKYTQDYEVGIKIVSTLFDNDNRSIIMESAREERLVHLLLEIPSNIYDEIINNLKVEEYIRHKSSLDLTEKVDDILRTKKRETENSKSRLITSIKELIEDANIFIAGNKININIKEPKTKINEALMQVINNIFTKFSYVEDNFNRRDIEELFNENTQSFLERKDDFINQKAYDELKEFFIKKKDFKRTVTIRETLQEFEKAPYGFNEDDILYLITMLLKNEVILLKYANEVQNITKKETLEKILKSSYYDRTLIEIREKIDKNLIDDLEKLARDSFDLVNLRQDEDGMVEDFKEKALRNKHTKLRSLLVNYNYDKYSYPGREVLKESIDLIENFLNINDTKEFFVEVNSKLDNIKVNMEETRLIEDFFEGAQKESFDKTKDTILIYEQNLDYIDRKNEFMEVVEKIKDIIENPKPYSDIHKLSTLRESLISLLGKTYSEKSKPIIESIEKTKERLLEEVKNSGIKESFVDYYISDCNTAIETLKRSNQLRDIYAQESRIKRTEEGFYKALQEEIIKLQKESKEADKPIKRKTYIEINKLANFKKEINSEEDIDEYLKELKAKLLDKLDDNNSLILR